MRRVWVPDLELDRKDPKCRDGTSRFSFAVLPGYCVIAALLLFFLCGRYYSNHAEKRRKSTISAGSTAQRGRMQLATVYPGSTANRTA